MWCYICHAKPTEINNLNMTSMKICNESNYFFDISPFYTGIRCMEYLLYIEYNMPFKKWSASIDVKKKTTDYKKETKSRN